MLSATVTVNLDHEPEDLDRADRAALQYLAQVPDGARLVVIVGSRELLMPSAIGWLNSHAHRLNVEISASTPHAARRWYDAIKSGRTG
jgi:hypothetical protein